MHPFFSSDSLKLKQSKKQDEISVKGANNNGEITKPKIFVPGLRRVDYKIQNTFDNLTTTTTMKYNQRRE